MKLRAKFDQTPSEMVKALRAARAATRTILGAGYAAKMDELGPALSEAAALSGGHVLSIAIRGGLHLEGVDRMAVIAAGVELVDRGGDPTGDTSGAASDRLVAAVKAALELDKLKSVYVAAPGEGVELLNSLKGKPRKLH